MARASSSTVGNWLAAGWQASRGALGAGLDLVFPPECAACRVPFERSQRPLLCSDCQTSHVGKTVPRCERCGARVPMATPASEGCKLCNKPKLHFDGTAVLGSYEATLRESVLRCKGRAHQLLNRALGEMLAEQCAEDIARWQVDVALPVPMHWRRRLWRGVNGPDLLAASLARRLSLRVLLNGVKRRRPTLPQSRVLADERRRNVQGAFAVNAGFDWRGTRVLLVDDILTTGQTCNEVANVLREAGAAAVFVAVVARAQGNL